MPPASSSRAWTAASASRWGGGLPGSAAQLANPPERNGIPYGWPLTCAAPARRCRPHLSAPLPPPSSVWQCGFFHPLQYFVGNRRSCQDRLDKHAVRRKRAAARKAGGLAAPVNPLAGGCTGGPPVAQLACMPSPVHTSPKLGSLEGAGGWSIGHISA